MRILYFTWNTVIYTVKKDRTLFSTVIDYIVLWEFCIVHELYTVTKKVKQCIRISEYFIWSLCMFVQSYYSRREFCALYNVCTWATLLQMLESTLFDHFMINFVMRIKEYCSNGITNSSRITLPLLLRNKSQTCAR